MPHKRPPPTRVATPVRNNDRNQRREAERERQREELRQRIANMRAGRRQRFIEQWLVDNPGRVDRMGPTAARRMAGIEFDRQEERERLFWEAPPANHRGAMDILMNGRGLE